MKTEQARFEAWLDRTRPSGDVESVQHRWLESSDYAYFCEELAEAQDQEIALLNRCTPAVFDLRAQIGDDRIDPRLPAIPIGDRFSDPLMFRYLGTGVGQPLLECWAEAVAAYAMSAIRAAEIAASWLPIATAPKEEDIFIGKFNGKEFQFIRSAHIWEQANEFAGETFSGWVWSEDEGCMQEPDYWMPLPKAPNEKDTSTESVS